MKIVLLTESLLIYDYSHFKEIIGIILDNYDVCYIRKDTMNDRLEIEAPDRVLYNILWELNKQYTITLL